MFDILLEYGFSKTDVLILTICPLLGALGGFIRAGMMISPIDTIPKNEKNDTNQSHNIITAFIIPINLAAGWVVVGAVTGLLISLLFVGALQEEASAIARVFALSLIAGYSAAQLWIKQDKLLQNIVEKEMLKYFGEKNSQSQKAPEKEKN